MSLKIRHNLDSYSIVLIFGVVAHYACPHPQNEKLTVYSSSPAVQLLILINICVFFFGEKCLIKPLLSFFFLQILIEDFVLATPKLL